MLAIGRARAIDQGILDGIEWVCADAERLPVADRSVDLYTIGFGLRNVTRINSALTEARRVLKPGGKLALQEVALGPEGPPHYPVQWAREPSISFLLSQETAREKLEAAGFRVLVWQDTTAAALESARR